MYREGKRDKRLAPTGETRAEKGQRLGIICIICSKPFGTKSDLKVHMVKHTGARDFECRICNQKFGLRAHLRRHMKVHTGERENNCPVCNQAFSRSDNLKFHLKTVHKDVDFKVIKISKYSQKSIK